MLNHRKSHLKYTQYILKSDVQIIFDVSSSNAWKVRRLAVDGELILNSWTMWQKRMHAMLSVSCPWIRWLRRYFFRMYRRLRTSEFGQRKIRGNTRQTDNLKNARKQTLFVITWEKTQLTFAQTYATCSTHSRSTERTSSYCVTRNILMSAVQWRCERS